MNTSAKSSFRWQMPQREAFKRRKGEGSIDTFTTAHRPAGDSCLVPLRSLPRPSRPRVALQAEGGEVPACLPKARRRARNRDGLCAARGAEATEPRASYRLSPTRDQLRMERIPIAEVRGVAAGEPAAAVGEGFLRKQSVP